MHKADLFAYLAAFVTVVLAIALTDMIQSTHRLMRARDRVKWDVLTPLLAAWVFLWVLSEFFSLWIDARYERINFFGLLSLMAVPTATALMAYAVLPDEVPADGLHLDHFYFDNRRYILGLMTLFILGDVARIVVYAFRYDGMDEFAPWISYLVIWTVSLATIALMYFVRSRWAQLTGLALLYARIGVHLLGGEWEIRAISGA